MRSNWVILSEIKFREEEREGSDEIFLGSLCFLRSENLGLFKSGNLDEAQAPGPGVDEPQKILVLAENRTRRLDILNDLKKYNGGWNITNQHYWASVGFTGAPGFFLAVLWFILFGVTLVIYHCCGWKINKQKGSDGSQKICLTLLIVFTFASVVGCIILSVGQDRFHSEVMQTLNYVVNQSDYTVQTLKNVTEYLSLAKGINLSQFNLPSDIEADIDQMSVELNSTAQALTQKTNENSVKIKRVFSAVAIGDTCTAMQEWAENPQAETALSDILPCVDEKTTNRTLLESKKVVAGVVNIVNQFIYTYADTNRPHGPLMPPLCYPFDDHMEDRQCSQQEVSMLNASLVWQRYVCVAENDMCVSMGRLTPAMYEELVTAVNVSYAIKHYTPPMLSLQNCNFVRDVFVKLSSGYCPGLEHNLGVVNAGLGMISVGIMLCLVIWILCADRPQREEVSVSHDSKHNVDRSSRASPVSSPFATRARDETKPRLVVYGSFDWYIEGWIMVGYGLI
ncbi:hypothetical protein V2J09_015064 [Rumex salicifolius]